MLQETCGCTVKLCKKEGFPYWDKYDFLCIETTHINHCWFGNYAPLDCRWAWCYMDSRAKVQAAKNATVCLNAVYTCKWFTLEDEIVGDTFPLIKRPKSHKEWTETLLVWVQKRTEPHFLKSQEMFLPTFCASSRL